MGELIKKLRKNKAPATPAGPSKANHSADWIYKKHLADQGLGDQPDAAPPAPTTGPVTAAPAGGIVETEEDRKRRMLAGSGIQI